MSDFYTNVKVYGDSVYFRGIKNGNRVKKKLHYKPTLFIPSNKSSNVWKTLDGAPVEPMVFESIKEAKQFKDQYREVNNFKIYGFDRYEYAFIADNFGDDIAWDSSLVLVGNIDIEVSSENGFASPSSPSEEITAITFAVNGKYYTFGCGDYVNDNPNVSYFKAENEKKLLLAFIDCWTKNCPDIITGWNIKFFDIPYIINRIEWLFPEENLQLKLSPWSRIRDYETSFRGKNQKCFDIVGVSCLDYLELYRKYSSTPNQESYRLDYITSVELGEKKLDYSEYSSLHQLYKRDYQKFLDYNIRDVELVNKLEEKLKLIELAMTLAYDSKVNYEDVFSQVRMWDSILHNYLKRKQIAVPPNSASSKTETYVGAYVKEPIVGKHDWVASFDLTSLYPSLIMMYNISLETKLKSGDVGELSSLLENCSIDSLLHRKIDTRQLKKRGASITPNGKFFRNDKLGYLPEIVQSMFEDRQKYKKLMLAAQKELEKVEAELAKRK